MARAVWVVTLLLAVAGLYGPAAPVAGLPGIPHPEAAPADRDGTATSGPGAGIPISVPSPVVAGGAPAPVRLPGVAGVPPPVAIELPSLASRAPIVPVGVRADGQLTVPDDPGVVGWWRDGAPALVLDGHIDSAVAGIGALFRLAALTPGDPLTLTSADGARHAFVVTSVRAYVKKLLPPEVFTAEGELVVISCGGTFDRSVRQYTDNIVVRARPA